eukprot:UN04954
MYLFNSLLLLSFFISINAEAISNSNPNHDAYPEVNSDIDGHPEVNPNVNHEANQELTSNPTDFPTYLPTPNPTREATFEGELMFPNEHISSKEIEAEIRNDNPHGHFAVYTLILVLATIIFVILSLLFYKQCIKSTAQKKGYTLSAQEDSVSRSDGQTGFHPQSQGINFYID